MEANSEPGAMLIWEKAWDGREKTQNTHSNPRQGRGRFFAAGGPQPAVSTVKEPVNHLAPSASHNRTFYHIIAKSSHSFVFLSHFVTFRHIEIFTGVTEEGFATTH
jgi:hypothetical protein